MLLICNSIQNREKLKLVSTMQVNFWFDKQIKHMELNQSPDCAAAFASFWKLFTSSAFSPPAPPIIAFIMSSNCFCDSSLKISLKAASWGKAGKLVPGGAAAAAPVDEHAAFPS